MFLVSRQHVGTVTVKTLRNLPAQTPLCPTEETPDPAPLQPGSLPEEGLTPPFRMHPGVMRQAKGWQRQGTAPKASLSTWVGGILDRHRGPWGFFIKDLGNGILFYNKSSKGNFYLNN